jgi:hypothetical protein
MLATVTFTPFDAIVALVASLDGHGACQIFVRSR